MIDQVTVFLPNEPGTLANMSDVLGKAGVQILAIMVADSTDFCSVRLIVDDTPRALDAFHKAGLSAATTKVIAVDVPDVPGGLASVVTRIASADLNIQYAYSCSIRDRAVDVIRVTGDPVAVKLCEIDFHDLALSDLLG